MATIKNVTTFTMQPHLLSPYTPICKTGGTIAFQGSQPPQVQTQMNLALQKLSGRCFVNLSSAHGIQFCGAHWRFRAQQQGASATLIVLSLLSWFCLLFLCVQTCP